LYSGDELRKIGAVSEWARVLRQLKQDGVIVFEVKNNLYDIAEINEYTVTTRRAGLNSKDKYRIRNRDGHRCQSCGKGVAENVKLHVDHRIPLDCGGTNLDENLWTLCEECNLAKRAFFRDDLDLEVMKLVFKQTSGYQKLKVLFMNSSNKKFSPSILQGIAGIRDWERTVRLIRSKDGVNIVWHGKSGEWPNGFYVNEV